MSGHLGLANRLTKLRTMSWAEIAHRLAYRVYVARERRAFTRGRLAPPDRLQAALLPQLRTSEWRQALLASRARHATRFFPSLHDREALRSVFDQHYQAERADMRTRAAMTREQRFEFFGAPFHYPGDISWQSDPVTGQPWPARFHADVAVHRGDVGSGDVKHVWELSRQQYLIDLGKSVYLDDDRESLRALTHLVRSWINGNPYGTGVNWSVALEPAFRSFSWLWAYFLAHDALEPDFHIEWLEGFYDHGRFIHAHLEHYSSPYNHLIGEVAALYMLGACFPELQEAQRWRDTAKTVLERRLAEQFYEDGGSVEQSTFYHHATVGYLLLAALTARAIGDELPRPVWQAIERGLDFSLALTQPDGRTPEIGGADDGKPIRMEHLPFWDFRPYLAIGAVLFGRADFKQIAGRFHEDALWLLGPRGRETFEQLPAAVPDEASRALPASGYYVMRTNWSADADYVCVDCGEQAAGMRRDAIPNSMHGHADCLSVVVWLRGRRVLVDSGLFAYNCGGVWEAHFRETAAHNTARVDQRDQAKHLGKMAWSHSYRAHAEGWHPGAPDAWVVGAHDGYERGAHGVTHRRAVWASGTGCVVIADEFVGAGTHAYEVNYQFAPDATLNAVDANAFRYGDVAALRWAGNVEWQALTYLGGSGPEEGWIAPSLGVRCAAPRLSLQTQSDRARVSLITVLTAGGASAPAVASTGDGFEVRDAETTDVVRWAQGDTRPAEEPMLTITRTKADGTTRVVRVSAHAGRLLDTEDTVR